jgi:hypothetical protein
VPHFRFASLLGLIWLCAMQVTPAFAITPSIGMSGDAVAQQRFWEVIVGSGGFQVGSPPSAHMPEPGIVAALGFGLLLLGVSYGRSAARSGRPRGAIGMGTSPWQSSPKVASRGPP